jgi:hypothetical protein
LHSFSVVSTKIFIRPMAGGGRSPLVLVTLLIDGVFLESKRDFIGNKSFNMRQILDSDP